MKPGDHVCVTIGDTCFQGFLANASKTYDAYEGSQMEVTVALDGNPLMRAPRAPVTVKGRSKNNNEEKKMDYKAYVDYNKRTRSYTISIEDKDGKFLTELTGGGRRLERSLGQEMPVAATIPEELFRPILAAARGAEGMSL